MMPKYYTESFVGNPIDVAHQVEMFCQDRQYDYPDTFEVVSASMVGTTGSVSYILVYKV